jgi:hypothetical protein
MTGTNSRIFAAATAGKNAVFGHFAGKAGLVYVGAWATSSAASTVTGNIMDWVVTCVSAASSSSVVVYINGLDRTVSSVGPFTAPSQLGINTYMPSTVYTEQSNFAAAEFLTWNVSLSASQLWQISSYLSTRYVRAVYS